MGPVLRADSDAQVDGRDLFMAVLSEDGQGCCQDSRHSPGDCHDEEARVPREAPTKVEDDAAVTLQSDDSQGQDGHMHTQGLGKRHHVAQHSPELPLIQQSVNQSEGQAESVHQEVCQGQVSYEEVGHCSHGPVANNHVDDQSISQQTQQNDEGISCDQGDLDSKVLGDVSVETRWV